MKRILTKPLTNLILAVSAFQASTALAQMDHSAMQMEASATTVDGRDPHAYSDGYTLTEGPYAQPGPRQLKLADEHAFWSVLVAWYGTTYDRFVIKAEGDIADGTLEESSTDLLWGHAFNAFFDTQLGVRLDQYDEGKDRQWLAFGVQGLAPYWFELDVTAYVGDDGRTSLSAEAEYELLLTQKLILQPRAELNLYGKNDAENGLGSGLSDLAVGLRLRYEFSRQFAPYIGVEWTDTYGDTADYRRAVGQDTSGTQFVAGLRFWF
jgi:copper resistance protein B